MDSTDIKNTLVLDPESLPAEFKEVLSRMQPGDKLRILDGTFTLIENGEKVVSLAINDGDSLTIKADPSESETIKFKMGDSENVSEPKEEDEENNDSDSVSVSSMKAGTYEPPVPG